MKEIVNEIVLHKKYGIGTIEAKDENNYIWVRFANAEPGRDRIRFLYPDAFETFLSFGDQQLQSQAIILLKEKRREKEIEDERKKTEREAINNKTLKPIKTKPKPQPTTRRSTERMTYKDWESHYPGYVIIQKEGFMYTAHNESAEALNEVLDYELFTDTYERITTGGPDGAKIGFALEASNYKYVIVEYGEIVDKYDGI